MLQVVCLGRETWQVSDRFGELTFTELRGRLISSLAKTELSVRSDMLIKYLSQKNCSPITFTHIHTLITVYYTKYKLQALQAKHGIIIVLVLEAF